MSKASNVFRCTCCDEPKTEDASTSYDAYLEGPVCEECKTALLFAEKRLLTLAVKSSQGPVKIYRNCLDPVHAKARIKL